MWLQEAVERAPLYRGEAHTYDRLEEAVAAGDPLGGRGDPEGEPVVYLQATRELPLYWALGADDLERLGEALARLWARVGIGEGETVVLYDYASSPLVAFASSAFLTHLERGASELTGCTVVCNDGLPELAERCVHVLAHAPGATLVIDAELLEPFARALTPGTAAPARVVVAGDESLLTPSELAGWEERLSTEVVQLLRADAALFWAAPCPRWPAAFHPEPDDFLVGTGTGGELSLTNLLVRSTVVAGYRPGWRGRVEPDCDCGVEGARLVIDAT